MSEKGETTIVEELYPIRTVFSNVTSAKKGY